MDVNLLKGYLKLNKLAMAFKQPHAAFEILRSTSYDIPHLCRTIRIGSKEFDSYIDEIRSNEIFNSDVIGKLKSFEQRLKKNGLYTGTVNEMQGLLIYAMIRALKPDTVLETGVASGLSSSCILLALDKNKKGELYSIDLPWEEDSESFAWATMIPKGCVSGWLIPDKLRYRWILKLGRSCDVMPSLLTELKGVDIFLHDSDHSYECMIFEYEKAWPYIRQGGVLLSHDIELNNAFADFSSNLNVKAFNWRGSFGWIVKT